MNFRRLITAIALLALCVGLASAQVVIGTPGGPAGVLSCSASVAAPPTLRSEGITELIGDIVLTCTGGPVPVNGAAIPTANFTVSLGTNVTSRILNTSNNLSEALLLVNDPGSALTSPVTGFGPQAPQTPCTGVTGGASVAPTGCGVQTAVQVNATGVADTTGAFFVASTGPGVATQTPTVAPNIFQGIVNGNQVIFNGIPILAPSTTGIATTFRITNVRANASGLGTGGLPGTTQVLASISISGNTALPVNNPVVITGFTQKGLSTSVQLATDTGKGVSSTPLPQCATQTKTAVATLAFTENFATAFKIRGVPPQNMPGHIYNTESGFIDTAYSNSAVNGTIVNAGQADFGTRLKAVFNNLPAGARIFVATTNNTAAANSLQPATANAVLVVSETTPDTGATPPVLPPTTTIAGPGGPPATTINLTELPVVGNSATAVWEVINTNPSLPEQYFFGVYISYTASPATGSPTAPNTATVNMSYAPTSTVTTASDTAPIPRFADTSSASTLFSTAICQTVLLYPFVTNQAGFDTGIAIANTSTDPFGTGAQAGTCTLNFFGNTAPAAAVPVPSVASGTVFTTLASVAAPGFQGYMFAVCNFQMAHGFAFISDLGARNLAMGYLAEIMPTGNAKRPATGTLGDTNGLAF